MTDEISFGKISVQLTIADITDLEIDSFVYYARPDLILGSGFGTAITMRGGPAIQDELKEIGPVDLTEAVISSAGDLKAKYIIHAVGPAFQEEDLEVKLRRTIVNVLKLADEKGITRVAFPPMGAGFYGVPLETSAEVMLDTIGEYAQGDTGITDVVISLLDNREFKPFQTRLKSLSKV